MLIKKVDVKNVVEKDLPIKKSTLESDEPVKKKNVDPEEPAKKKTVVPEDPAKKKEANPDEQVVKKSTKHSKAIKTVDVADAPVKTTATQNPDKITLPTEYEAESDVSSDAPIIDIPETTTVKSVKKKLKEIMLEIDDSDPNQILVFKKSFEVVPKGCPADVGFIGCTIIEKCHVDSECGKSEKCCMKNCVRSCISI